MTYQLRHLGRKLIALLLRRPRPSPPPRQLQLDLDELTVSGLPLRDALPIRTAEYWLLLGAAYAIPAFLFLTRQAGAWVLLPLLTVVPGVLLGRQIAKNEGRALNPTLVQTAKLLLGFGLLFAFGLALGGAS